MLQKVQVIDSHTGGEPTRVVIDGGPDLGSGGIAERLAVFRERFDPFRSAVVGEPRGSDVIVGALLTPPVDPSHAAGVIFFNNVGYIGMCGHGTIGLVTTLAHLGRIGPGEHHIETPVGTVGALLHPDGRVSVRNVPSYRLAKDVMVEVPGIGVVTGDVAWGGNNFFLVHNDVVDGPPLTLANVDALTDRAWRIRRALTAAGVRGRDGGEIDHIEFSEPATDADTADSRNFVLCPGGAYDRSPCGTGTSAKLACLFADGDLHTGDVWRQESIVGSLFEGSIARVGDDLIPTITGRAFVNGEATLLLDDADPFCWGIR